MQLEEESWESEECLSRSVWVTCISPASEQERLFAIMEWNETVENFESNPELQQFYASKGTWDSLFM